MQAWPYVVPGDLQAKIKERISERNRSKIVVRIEDPLIRLQYADVMDLHKIVDKNWDVFRERFESREALKSHFLALKNFAIWILSLLALLPATFSRKLPPPVPRAHLDFLHPARNLWQLRLRSVRLSELQRHVLGWERGADVLSGLIPQIYFDYLRGGPPDRSSISQKFARRTLYCVASLLLDVRAAKAASQVVDVRPTVPLPGNQHSAKILDIVILLSIFRSVSL